MIPISRHWRTRAAVRITSRYCTRDHEGLSGAWTSDPGMPRRCGSLRLERAPQPQSRPPSPSCRFAHPFSLSRQRSTMAWRTTGPRRRETEGHRGRPYGHRGNLSLQSRSRNACAVRPRTELAGVTNKTPFEGLLLLEVEMRGQGKATPRRRCRRSVTHGLGDRSPGAGARPCR